VRKEWESGGRGEGVRGGFRDGRKGEVVNVDNHLIN